MEQRIDDLGDVFVDIPALNELLVIGGGACDVERIAAAAVMVGVDAVEGIGNNGKCVCTDG